MKRYDPLCPHCGRVNYSRYLEETEGYFQCDYCNKVVLSQEYWPSEDVDDKFSYIPLMKSLAG